MRTFSIFFVVFFFASPALAQEVTRMPETSHDAVGLDAGLDAAFVARATYSRRFSDVSFLRDPKLYGRVTLPFVMPDLGDWGVDGGAQATLVRWRDLRVALALGPTLRKSDNEAFSSWGIGLGATLLAGYEGRVWGLSAEAGYEQLLTTHVTPSDAYRTTYYADAKSGWYAFTGATTHAGLRGGARIGAIELAARAGAEATGQLHAITPPFYATIGTTYAF